MPHSCNKKKNSFTARKIVLKVGRRVYRLVIIFQRRLERVPRTVARCTTSGRLLCGTDVDLVSHEAVSLFSMLLAAPDSEGNQAERAENNGTTDTDNNANDGVASLH